MKMASSQARRMQSIFLKFPKKKRKKDETDV